MSTEAQDDGVFTDEAGVKAWLADNQETLVAEATRRHAEAQAKWLSDKAEKAAAQKERQKAEKAAAQASKAAAQTAGSGPSA
jgi:hypothetical protein